MAYRQLFRNALDPGVVDQIRQATNGNLALGNDRFSEEIATLLGKRVTRGRPGRPKKTASKPESVE
jgi:putative transposase